MCNHYGNIAGAEDLISSWRDYIAWSLDSDIPQGSFETDLWPKREAMVVRDAAGGAVIDRLRWGAPLKVPGKRPGTTITRRVTNVRNLASPFWRSMLASPAQRCLVPFTRFAEPKPGAGREEVWFRVNATTVPAFAGIWRASEEGNVFAFLTCEPNPLVGPIHPKAMPVILHPEDYQDWLDGAPAQDFARPFPSQLMAVTAAD
ncbi:SOS response-associated peptidase family protein [Novosphingobium malaysiense]|uniref:Abasic site processing protein n=1 Tax=Novosphingobium malaysiense TaxID=1348853 RepID=A0A0B1ZJC6_9SPHN|nr:SOS response-associated peptidase family protein [Novosphingobium malaysiense]KHK89403.1 hypothetical protein LK12_19930 [Novosphingobium malaysiense]